MRARMKANGCGITRHNMFNIHTPILLLERKMLSLIIFLQTVYRTIWSVQIADNFVQHNIFCSCVLFRFAYSIMSPLGTCNVHSLVYVCLCVRLCWVRLVMYGKIYFAKRHDIFTYSGRNTGLPMALSNTLIYKLYCMFII